jgi:hypothetical protein
MRTTVLAYGGMQTSLKCLFLLLLFSLAVSPVLADVGTTLDPADDVYINKTYTLSSDNSTPFTMWVGAIALGIFLILLSFMSSLFPNGEEGLVSIIAWIPIAYALVSSFAVDKITSAGLGSVSGASDKFVLLESHTVYHFDVVAVCLFILLAFAVGNTYRIWVSQTRYNQVISGEI